jgi:hypothetical protein
VAEGLSKDGYQTISPLRYITATRRKGSRFRRLLRGERIGREVVQTGSRRPRLSRLMFLPRIGNGPDDPGRHDAAQRMSLNLEITSSISSRIALAFDQLDSAKAKHPFTASHASSEEGSAVAPGQHASNPVRETRMTFSAPLQVDVDANANTNVIFTKHVRCTRWQLRDLALALSL